LDVTRLAGINLKVLSNFMKLECSLTRYSKKMPQFLLMKKIKLQTSRKIRSLYL
jgi:hypothetical protein